MKLAFIFPLLLITSTSFAQDIQSPAPKTSQKKIQIGVNVSPDYCYRTLGNPSGGDTAAAIIGRRNGFETSRIGYTAGVSLQYRINDLISLEGGVQFSSKGYEIDNIRVTDYNNPQGGDEAKLIYEYQYIDIPLKANFFIGKKRLRFIGSTGIAANIFIADKSTLKYTKVDKPDESVPRLSGAPNMLSLSSLVSAGIDYKINDWMNVRIEPVFRYGLIKMYDAPIGQHLYSAGLNVGWYVAL
jgi:hypothetical protein